MALGKLGKYERVDVLGHGVSGIVYLAWDTLLKKQVALKEIDLQAADVGRFLEEARVMDRMNHPNIVRVNGVDKIDGRVVIDMEYVKGRNLQELLRDEGRLPVDRALDIAIQTLDALDYAHRMRTVHRDVKPANILITRGGEVKLVDFGLAEILATNSYAGGAGTYAYMAPEDFAEEHRSDHQSDIWAVGVTLYEMLVGARPFNVEKARDPFAWRRTLLNERPTPLSDFVAASSEETDGDNAFPEGIQAVLDRALAKEKSDRYPTAGEFRDDLVALRAGRAPVAVAAETVRLAHAGVGACNGASAYPIPLSEEALSSVPSLREEENYSPNPLHPTPDTQHPVPRMRLWWRRSALPAHAWAEPSAVHFGELRKGDERTAHVVLKMEGGEGAISGRVTAVPGWMIVSPTLITRRKQRLALTVHSERAWQTGDFEDQVCVETSRGTVSVPVGVRVMKARPRFAEIAIWFVPLVVSVLLPALTVALSVHRFSVDYSAAYLVPAAALGSGLLGAMLLLVAFAADLGTSEKLTGGVLMVIMIMLLGMTSSLASRTGHAESLRALPATGVPIGILLFCQAMSRRHWKLWAVVLATLSLLTSGTFAAVLSGQL